MMYIVIANLIYFLYYTVFSCISFQGYHLIACLKHWVKELVYFVWIILFTGLGYLQSFSPICHYNWFYSRIFLSLLWINELESFAWRFSRIWCCYVLYLGNKWIVTCSSLSFFLVYFKKICLNQWKHDLSNDG